MVWEMGTLGLLNVVTYLEQEGHPIKHVYLTKREQETSEELNSILSFIEKTQPALIGFSLMSFNFERTRRISLAIRGRFPLIPIVWGGIHPTFDPEESLKYADYVCVGEGEEAMLELVQAIKSKTPVNGIRNIWQQNYHESQIQQTLHAKQDQFTCLLASESQKEKICMPNLRI